MLHLPDRLPSAVTLLVAAVLLAGLDLLGAVAAKNMSRTGSFTWFAAGALVFVVLFWVYGSVLDVAELSVVTLGWIVLLQVGVVILDRVRYQVHLGPGQILAVVVILALQGYLVLSTSGPAPEDVKAQQPARAAGA